MSNCVNGVAMDMLIDGESYPIISGIADVQAAYIEMRRKGESHTIAEMCALREGPTLKTDNTFFLGRELEDQFKSPLLRRYKAFAESQGVDVSGAKYAGSFAEYPGDPTCWVKSQGDVARLAERKIRSLDRPPEPDVPVGADIVRDRLEDVFDANPELERECLAKPAKFEEVTNEVRESLLPDYTPEPIPAL